MPTYVYQVVRPDGSLDESSTFEAVQSMKDQPLTTHPVSGHPVRRVILAPNVAGEHTSAADKRKTSDSNMERLGFTKLVKGDKGYEKAYGKGLTPNMD